MLQKIFVIAQGGLILLIVGALWFFARSQNPESRFKVRESDLKKPSPPPGTAKAPFPDDLAQARITPRAEPLRLAGIRLDGAPHEILGVPQRASADEVRLAYRELMKRYHPDRIGPPGSREWKDAQRIAEKINEAKEFLLKRAGPKS